MTTPLEKFKDWLDDYASTNGYSISRGMWNEDDTAKKFIALWIEGGRKPVAQVQYANVRLVVTGRRNTPSDASTAEKFAHDTMSAAIEQYKGECLAYIEPLGNIMGPYYTEARRPWYEINFQLIL